MKHSKCVHAVLLVLPLIFFASCGGTGNSSSTSTPSSSQDQASVFTIGTDAPLPSVVSCAVTITGVTINNGSTNVSVFSGSQSIDFAQLSGLHQLLDLNAVPTGTYTSATVTLSSPVIGYIDTTQTPPAVSTIDGSLTQNSVTVTFAQPFTLTNADLVGLRMELDLRKSLQTNSSGQVTGVMNPVFEMALLNSTDANVSIDEFLAGVVGVTGSNSFTVQGPAGRQWNVQTSNSTVFDDSSVPISSFTTSTIVSVSGQLDPVTHNIDASEVQVVSTDNFFLGGLLTSVTPPSGPATGVGLYVRAELPSINGISDGQITDLTLNGTEVYRIGNISLPLTTLLFNNSALTAGQRVGIGGKDAVTNGNTTITVHRVVLRPQGQTGTLAGNPTIETGNVGSFPLNDNGLAGILLPSPLTIMTTNQTNFINLTGLSALEGQTGMSLRVVGFVLINPATNTPVLIARSVEQMTS